MRFFIKSAAVLTASATLAACVPAEGQYQGLSPLHRAQVSLTRFAHDMRISQDGSVDEAEQRRLEAFLRRVDVRYGDRVQLDKGARDEVEKAKGVVDSALYPYGLRASAEFIAIGDLPKDDVVRLVITRHLAAPPQCPNFSQPNSPNYANASSSNFSCSVRANLAAQVANPSDLVEGNKQAGPVPGEPERAIDSFRTRALTGTQSLQANSTGDAVGG